ncbi:acetolactate synthase-1/2/3 large subunit [Solirubrobacter pauli]|uniref:Acetolactate synthase-1/2/3 large subunit n=1 Tax=Solirubrobacter pauli TaxID=166793 RepID=A0A660LHI6_9ACTN|nr:thiamine pyrophosphate-dependent enzyme [Solirubrobacter pauli]RKQ93816.1 acetolactate synthase-1/2/3 large subunit [Solirubrobacter pauli]
MTKAAFPQVRVREVAEAVTDGLIALGVERAYALGGREISPMIDALGRSAIAVIQARHESGAGFMAIGDWMVSDGLTAIAATTGPGLANVINALMAARMTRMPLILLTPLTPPIETNRLGIQATGPSGFTLSELHAAGRLFDYVAHVHTADQLPAVFGRIARGLAHDPGFTAHIALPTTLQAEATSVQIAVPPCAPSKRAPSPTQVEQIRTIIDDERVAVWVGFGARPHAELVRRFVAKAQLPVLASPRALGIADGCATFVGVTGNGGHELVFEELARYGVERVLVLGSRLGEATSGWDARLVPTGGLIHVDHDHRAFGIGFPQAPTIAVEADIGLTLRALLDGPLARRGFRRRRPPRGLFAAPTPQADRLHPVEMLEVLQRVVVDAGLPYFADASSAMFWSANRLEFPVADRYFSEQAWGSMGFAGAAAVGAAAALRTPVFALCGDASMHMQDEINTAVKYDLPTIWGVMSNGGPSIVRFGMEAHGRFDHDGWYPDTDFAAVARAKGARATRVTSASQLEQALTLALETRSPHLIDIVLDPSVAPPIGARARR